MAARAIKKTARRFCVLVKQEYGGGGVLGGLQGTCCMAGACCVLKDEGNELLPEKLILSLIETLDLGR